MAPWYRLVRSVADALLRVLLVREVTGLARLPRTGGVILASNHGSFWDPPVLACSVPRELRFLAKSELFRIPILGRLIRSVGALPIRRGVSDHAGLERARRALADGQVLLVFPEGGRMKDRRLHPARPGVGLLEAHARVPIVPVYVSGTDRIRRCLLRLERVRIAVGEPLPETLWFSAGVDPPQTGRALHQAIGDRIMQEIALLKRQQEEATTKERGGST